MGDLSQRVEWLAMGALFLARHILNHPLNRHQRIRALTRFVRWQLAIRMRMGSVLVPWIGPTRLFVRKGSFATQSVYCGLAELEEMGFLLHYLRPGDEFVDAGANVGMFTVFASGVIGAHSVSFEPAPSTYDDLLDNVLLNRISDLVCTVRSALGDETGTLKFTSCSDATNHVVVEHEPSLESVEVPVTTLDLALTGRCPTLLKLDVEGYETSVIRGAKDTMEDVRLQAIIIEFGHQCRYGGTDEGLHDMIVGCGFSPVRYDPITRSLTNIEGFSASTKLYVRDLQEAIERVSNAPRFNVLDQMI